MFRKKKNHIRDTAGDRALEWVTRIVLALILIIVGYPVIYVVSCSFSSAKAIAAGQVLLWPVEPTLAGYEFVFQYDKVWIGYRNTIFYTFFGTIISVSLAVLCAYPLSKKHFQWRGFYTSFFLFTMLFSAGMIPTYIIKSRLGLVDTVWAVLLAGALSIHNMIIVRTAFQNSIPGELFDAAQIDGANDFQCLTQIAIPLAKATISVITLYCIVGCWNDYFNAMLYLRNQDLFPLQLILRTILTAGESLDMTSVSATMLEKMNDGTQQIKYCLIVISTVPVLLAYAVVQKYFRKGVMIGSVKG